MTVVCCKCKKVRIKGEWKRCSDGSADAVSHTYCPACLDHARSETLPSAKNYAPRLTKHVPVFLSARAAEL